MKANRLGLTLVLSAAMVSAAVADDDVDLPLNGDFRGAAVGRTCAPGWILNEQEGESRILATNDRDEFALELKAAPDRAKTVRSELHQVPLLPIFFSSSVLSVGNLLTLQLEARGTGRAAFGFEAFDDTRVKQTGSGSQAIALTGKEQELKHVFALPPQTRFVRILLTAEAGSSAVFQDVEAEVSITQVTLPSGTAEPAAR